MDCISCLEAMFETFDMPHIAAVRIYGGLYDVAMAVISIPYRLRRRFLLESFRQSLGVCTIEGSEWL